MPELRLDGCRATPLAGYLKALGLVRVVARQFDPAVRARWDGETLVVQTEREEDELVGWLLDGYAPSPVVSPWNGGSGFFPRDNTRALDAIMASSDPRLAPFRTTVTTARATLDTLGVATKPEDRDTKLAIVRELQARLPDDALDWLEAAVVLRGAKRVSYPPLLGSGGNDGRFDVSNNYAQAVVTVLGEDRSRERSEALLRAALRRAAVPLVAQSMAHFHRDASPVNSPTGESDGLSNPWDLVLAVEGALVMIAGAARRNGTFADAAIVAPFTVRATASGYGTAVAGEKGRAELWLPLWSRWMGFAELETLMREGRAQVGRRQARTGLDVLRACALLGVDRSIGAFLRYVLLERAGQATLAVPVGRYPVTHLPAVAALDTIQSWLDALADYAPGSPQAHRRAIQRLEGSAFAFAATGAAADACTVIEAMGEVETTLTAGNVGTTRPQLRPLTGVPASAWLGLADDGSREFAVAASLASLRDPVESSDGLPAMRDYLHGTSRGRNGRRAYVQTTRSRVPRRTAARTRLAALHRRRHLDAERARPTGDLRFPFGFACPLPIAGAFASGQLAEARIGRLLAGLALFDYDWHETPAFKATVQAVPVPAFELLALAWAGTDARATGEDEPGDAAASRLPAVRLAPRRGWAAQLAAGRTKPVVRDALLRLRMADLPPTLDSQDVSVAALDAELLSAALLLPIAPNDRRAVARRLCRIRNPEAEGAG